ncbi:6-O-methylguanine DNA methyltransferase [Mycena belliarum]|uniref:Methylated-DNA--protein-cysteine methyltransferase n=1 Tax=Mycena belliarum TaxID=1033014 RepID=A0AAD6U368_9AGAR|nr:6-O-methylguanine DNA methyltransferase [Mycena belliae]
MPPLQFRESATNRLLVIFSALYSTAQGIAVSRLLCPLRTLRLMPVTRTGAFTLPASEAVKYATRPSQSASASSKLDSNRDLYYPTTSALRAQFRTQAGKRVTTHQWAVYDFTRTIPAGKVATYKDVSQAVGGSPRSVGSALRANPFAPVVPCHRVIASSRFVGGFFGEWGKGHGTGMQCGRKLGLLASEGVDFTAEGYLKGADFLWRGE